MIYMCLEIEKIGTKSFQFFPLRTDITPKFIPIDTKSIIELFINEDKNKLHEANLLYLDCNKAKKELGWYPKWHIEDSIKNTVEWYKSFYDKSDIAELSLKFLAKYNNL